MSDNNFVLDGYGIYDVEFELARTTIEQKEKWRDWGKKLPALKLDPDWEIKVIPPFGGALARLVVLKGEMRVSVYFDAYARLGGMYDLENGNPIPYWEIYPAPKGANDCIKRYFLGEEPEMLEDIRKVLNGDRYEDDDW